VAKLCNQCGQPLLKEDSRFCNRCGAEVSPDASSSPIPRRTGAIAGQYASPAPGTGAGSAGARPALREQIAFAPPSRPASPLAPGGAPPWLGRLDRMSASPVAKPQTQNFSPDTPPRVANPPSGAGRPFSPDRSRLPQRELRIKVWEGEDADSPNLNAPVDQRHDHAALSRNNRKEEQAQIPQAPSQQQAEEASEVEDLPTALMPAMSGEEQEGHAFSPVARREQPASDNAGAGEEDRGDADLPTRPMVAHLSVPEQVHVQRSSERRFPAQSYRQAVPPQSRQMRDQQQQGFSAQVGPIPNQPPIRQQPVTPTMPTSYPGFQQPVAAPTVAPVEKVATPTPARPARRQSKMRLVVVLATLLILLGGGLIYWVVAFQPFSVPAVTRTSLTFSNASLGIALQYPQGWTDQLDAAHQTVSFFDANRVDQVTISETASNGSSVATAMNKEVAQLGLTAQKSLSPATFAGTTWQRVQGTLLVSGATDTEILLVAQHGNHLYTIAQIAPAATYTDADSLFFSMFRANFQFL
jgi:hypothetical protein